jgi:ABC-type sugar transport system permease subunit
MSKHGEITESTIARIAGWSVITVIALIFLFFAYAMALTVWVSFCDTSAPECAAEVQRTTPKEKQ